MVAFCLVRWLVVAWLSMSVVAATGQPLLLDETRNQQDLAGYWLGSLEGALRLLLRVPLLHHDHTHPVVTLYSLDQEGSMIPANEVEIDEKSPAFVLHFDAINGRFEATLDERQQVIKGTWFQGPYKFPLELERFHEDNSNKIPKEFRFLLQKAVTGPSADLLSMVGFWSGFLDDSFDEKEPEPPELVILEIEKITDDLVEPKIYLPSETPLALWVRSLVLSGDGAIKIVLDESIGDNNAIFEGRVDGHTIKGVVRYDDTEYTPPLVLKWTSDRPEYDPKIVAE